MGWFGMSTFESEMLNCMEQLIGQVQDVALELGRIHRIATGGSTIAGTTVVPVAPLPPVQPPGPKKAIRGRKVVDRTPDIKPEFYTFDDVLRELNIDENRLKRLVSEGELRCFRNGDQLQFKRKEIDSLSGKLR